MSNNIKKLVAAGALAGFLGFGGMSLASAQEDPSTTTTAPEATDDGSATTPAPPTGDENCPNMGGDTSSSTSSVPADAANGA